AALTCIDSDGCARKERGFWPSSQWEMPRVRAPVLSAAPRRLKRKPRLLPGLPLFSLSLLPVITVTRAFGDCTMAYPPVMLPCRLSRRSRPYSATWRQHGRANGLYWTDEFGQIKHMHTSYERRPLSTIA